MGQDIRQDIPVSGTSVTISLNNLPDGSNQFSSAMDLGGGTPATAIPFALSMQAELAALAGGTATVDIYAEWSNDNVIFAEALNDQLVAVVQMNAALAVIKMFSVPVLARYLKLRVENNSGTALAAASNLISFWPVAVDQV